jgi:choline dehydrogenase-like flavoprotein
MAIQANPDTARPTDEIVDVLIIGAGASGAAVAWSLAETRMRILCLEQGDWIKPTEFPSNGRDWEARRYTDFDISPNRRARDTDYPINDDNSPMKIANFNVLAAARSSSRRTTRACIRPTSASGRWMGWRTTGRSTTGRSNPILPTTTA